MEYRLRGDELSPSPFTEIAPGYEPCLCVPLPRLELGTYGT